MLMDINDGHYAYTPPIHMLLSYIGQDAQVILSYKCRMLSLPLSDNIGIFFYLIKDNIDFFILIQYYLDLIIYIQ